MIIVGSRESGKMSIINWINCTLNRIGVLLVRKMGEKMLGRQLAFSVSEVQSAMGA